MWRKGGEAHLANPSRMLTYYLRAMRGAGPAIPERAGAHLCYTITPQFRCSNGDAVPCEPAARVTKGHTMNPNLRRKTGPQRPQAARRPQNGGSNVRQHYERYMARARDAQLSGDAVEMENCYQHAEHYFRVMKDQTN